LGKVDSAAKEYFSDNNKFADLCNGILFEGEQVITPEALEERDSTEVLSVFGIDPEQMHLQKWRDLLKNAVVKTTQNICIVLFGIEAQANVHYAMPVKNMLYDGINYGNQVNQAAKRHRRKQDTSGDEFLSGFTIEDKLTPVVTITLYLGDREWNAPRNLKDMFPTLDERLLPFISDYKANVIIPGEMEDFDRFKTDLKQVLEVLSASGNKDRMKEILDKDKQFKNLTYETVKTINDFAGTDIPLNQKGSVIDMCKAWKDQFDSGIEQGMEQGLAKGIVETSMEFHLSEEDILAKLQEKLNITLQKAREYFVMFGKQPIH